MALRDSLDALTDRRFRTGRPCLDFVHTGGVGRWKAAELVHSSGDAGYWLALVLDLDVKVQAGREDLEALRRLREAIWQIAQAAVAGRRPPAEQVDVVNEAAATPPPRPRMTASGASGTAAPVTAVQALSALARDAIDLFTGPLRQRVRTCAADDCELLFVDSSRAGGRRWCSMARCGSREKMRRYRAP